MGFKPGSSDLNTDETFDTQERVQCNQPCHQFMLLKSKHVKAQFEEYFIKDVSSVFSSIQPVIS